VLNPALLEMAARDRIAEMHRAGAKRPGGTRGDLADADWFDTPPVPRHPRIANRQRAIGWFLISVGLRLAVPRTRTGSGR
jgi:hypothetical protein